MIIEVRQTILFRTWLDSLKDRRAQAKIAQRIIRMQSGLMGDVKSVGDGVSELRVDHGPGYRIYFTRRATVVIVLVCGGDKSTQRRNIAQAKAMIKDLE